MLKLRPYKKCDAKSVVKWIKDQHSFSQWCANRLGTFPLTEETLNAHYEEQAYTDNFYVMTALEDNEVVGHLFMRSMDEDMKNIRFGYVIVDSDKRGKGYGKGMLKLAIKYAFEFIKAEKVSLGVFENNPNAHYCYKSVGFVDHEEANWTIPIGDEQWTCICMELNREQYREDN